MKIAAKALSRSTAGSALIELALTLPIFLFFLVGITDFGRYVYASIEVCDAAHAAAQYGAQNHATASDIAGMQLAAANAAPDIRGMTTTPTHSCACSDGTSNPSCTLATCTGSVRLIEFVQVNTSATIQPIAKYPGLSESSLTVQGQAIIRTEQ